MPIPTAASVFAIAKSRLSVPAVNANIVGSIKGEASQNAITAGTGTPIARSAAIKGITPQEQNGDIPPNNAAKTIMMDIRPWNAFAMRLSAPLARAHAATPMAKTKNGAMPVSASATKAKLASACSGTKIASPIKIATTTNQAFSIF